MKQITLKLTRKGGEEILSIAEPGFAFACMADRIVIDDQREAPPEKKRRLATVTAKGSA